MRRLRQHGIPLYCKRRLRYSLQCQHPFGLVFNQLRCLNTLSFNINLMNNRPKPLQKLEPSKQIPELIPGKSTVIAGPNSNPYPVAAVWRRVAAQLVDAVTVFFIHWIVGAAGLIWAMNPPPSDRWHTDLWGEESAGVVSYVIFHFVYSVVFLRLNKGQTPGMDLMKVRAVRTKDGQYLGIIRCTARWLIDGCSWLVPPVVLGGLAVNTVSYLPTSVDRRRRTVADWLAGTTIIAYDRDREAE